MQFQDFPVKIKKYTSLLYQGLKNIVKIPHFWKYFIIAVFSTLLFVIITFPYDIIIMKKLHNYEGKAFRTISVKDIEFSLFKDIVINDAYIVLNNGDEIEFKNSAISLNKNPWKLLYKKNIVTDFQVRGLKYLSPKFDSTINLNGNADFFINNSGPLPVVGNLKLLISSGIVRLNEITFQGPLGPMSLKIGTIQLSAVNCDFEFISGSININRFELTGDDLSGTVTGNIKPGSFLPASSVNLTINLNPDSGILSEYRDMILPMVKNDTLTLYISGTLGKPDIRLSPGE
jgi:hypothetical protein